MIYHMPLKEYFKLHKLVANLAYFPEIKAVIKCNNPGEIYVDNLDNPKSALVWNQGMQGFYLVGDPNNDCFNHYIDAYIKDYIVEMLREKNIDWFEVSGHTDSWNTTIEKLFTARDLKYGLQLINIFDENKFLTRRQDFSTFDIRKVNKDTFNLAISNLDFLKKELEQFWGSIEQFLDKGLCIYAIENDKIVSICYSGFKADNVYAIGIETLKDYRRQGYAYAVASCFIEECLKKNHKPYWDCMASNLGSKCLAEKLGFIHKDTYRCYWFKF